MGYSKHYTNDRTEREAYIKKVGIGEVVYRRTIFDESRGRKFVYEVTTTAMVIVRAYDDQNLIITQYPARPSRIKKIWENPDPEILRISIEYSRSQINI